MSVTAERSMMQTPQSRAAAGQRLVSCARTAAGTAVSLTALRLAETCSPMPAPARCGMQPTTQEASAAAQASIWCKALQGIGQILCWYAPPPAVA